MTHAFLQSELTSLISDSKRRHHDVRTAAERSLADLKAITVTSEIQLAGDLLRRPQFIDSFVLACKSKNVKLASIGTICLQRLTASSAVARAKLPDVLDAFREGVAAGYEPQLKILQTLPSLFQFYASDLHGDLLARTLEICAVLQSSKTAIVSNTAAATFEQLVSTVFEQADKNEDRLRTTEGQAEDAEPSEAAEPTSTHDADRLFYDLCLLIDQQQPEFLAIEGIPPGFLLETLQSLLSNYRSFLVSHASKHPDHWEHLVDGLSQILVRKDSFGVVVRAWSILALLFQGYAEPLKGALTRMIPILLSTLEKDGNPPWKRALCLEFFRKLCTNFGILANVFELFDNNNEQGKLVGPMLSSFVRIAAEDPSLIGLGRQSTVPIQRANDINDEDVASIEAQGLGGAITSVSARELNSTGISMEWSVLETSLMDQADKQSPPAIPSTYIHALVLGCISSFCDGLSKFVMPLSVPGRAAQPQPQEAAHRDSSSRRSTEDDPPRKSTRSATSAQKYQRLINPLTTEDHPQLPQIRSCANMVEACWPAALAISSTFLNAALDSEFYHILVRSVQKLAQVSGVLELPTPRDALLTTLAKASIPANASNVITAYQNSTAARTIDVEPESPQESIKSPGEPPQTPTFQTTSSSLNVRHLLCLRALLNLGIALGPTLEQASWFILIETMQTVEALISIPTTLTSSASSTQLGGTRSGLSAGDGQTTLTNEISAVQAATKRMLESTRGYTSDAFAVTIKALFRLVGQVASGENKSPIVQAPGPAATLSPKTPVSGRQGHRISRSVSGLWSKSKSLDLETDFVLGKISELARINIHRFVSDSETSCSWELIGSRLLEMIRDVDVGGSHRVYAANVLDQICVETVKYLDEPKFEVDQADAVQSRCLQALFDQVEFLYESQDDKPGNIELEIHQKALEALESIVSHAGETLGNNWFMVFRILSTTFFHKRGEESTSTSASSQSETREESAQILRASFRSVQSIPPEFLSLLSPSFRSVQLITSDFLTVLGPKSLISLAGLLRMFGSQDYDLNIALTSTTLLWSLASQVLTGIEQKGLEIVPSLDIVFQSPELRNDSSTLSILWSAILIQLVQLSQDVRPDVRNAAIKILLKFFEGSSESLDPQGWSEALAAGPLRVLQSIAELASRNEAEPEWLASGVQLTEGIVHLLNENLTMITKHQDFGNTWQHIVEVFKDLLDTASLTAFSVVFSNLSKLLSSLAAIGKGDSEVLLPVLRLWATYHPDDVKHSFEASARPDEEKPSQSAVTAHLHLLVEANKVNPDVVMKFEFNGRGMAAILMGTTERAVVYCSHPPYTSDIKNLSPEQEEACGCLTILKTILSNSIADYAQFLLRLLNLTLGIQNGCVVHHPRRSAMTKSTQKPSFIAFASACLDRLRALVLEHATNDKFTQVLMVKESLHVLAAIIGTKYTNIPTNPQAPLWRNATVTAVATLEALRTHVKSSGDSDTAARDLDRLSSLGDEVIAIVSSVLGSGGLSNHPDKHTTETLREDEVFDMEHFQLAHNAVVTVFQHDKIAAHVCTQYAITLFQASLLAEPWLGDLSDDLVNEPLKGLTEVRSGSVRRPVFVPRRRICYSSLDALFDLMRLPPQQAGKDGDNDNTKVLASSDRRRLAFAACPYLCLRTVHPLKVFLADQRLRGLSPPPVPQQAELQTVLSKYVELRSDNDAFEKLAALDQEQSQGQGQRHARHPSSTSGQLADGKAHLRVLYPFLLRVERFWRELPRLKGEGAWQAQEFGKGIEESLERWHTTLAEGWGFE
ncbi:Endocytosis and vacuole integrity protein [Exophiala dermatitidis]|uniref:Uncharacterized protein n=2 Tax=Exophiala dermatitidis TaxID=5970 RepID=H6BXB1_EXODN|nr:uncharacterized protein HMPREF1120_04303 [Exophiala dermatitidis NIH/UT8656]KAJ4505269.1 Endocytosis and vacuole integrity protein [Exophiala dermatitidis]EHY56213.1 hypothetical protein HMPREF1120_04303 [Exophiala dermatitidis NIH/UT8656]KAJ4505728.1 Endocytosis and vacuole integrity protein [Exophiala dermatitidis]KAJ4536345.1 Endocytosis and vacuole integrity protein [Exophiala dermatitidis]KAJ4541127.1 Endocytosis and vacuole integrity protein [Exophiala dermatitidis]